MSVTQSVTRESESIGLSSTVSQVLALFSSVERKKKPPAREGRGRLGDGEGGREDQLQAGGPAGACAEAGGETD